MYLVGVLLVGVRGLPDDLALRPLLRGGQTASHNKLEGYEAELELEPRWVTVDEALEANRAVQAGGVGVMRWLVRETAVLEWLATRIGRRSREPTPPAPSRWRRPGPASPWRSRRPESETCFTSRTGTPNSRHAKRPRRPPCRPGAPARPVAPYRGIGHEHIARRQHGPVPTFDRNVSCGSIPIARTASALMSWLITSRRDTPPPSRRAAPR